MAMPDSFRPWLLRRVALGLPILAFIPACEPAPCPDQHTTVILDPATLAPREGSFGDAMGVDAGPSEPLATAMDQCRPLCMSFGTPPFVFQAPVFRTCSAAMSAGNDVVLSCRFSSGCVGRVPEGLVSAILSRPMSVGDWLARAAHLEAASVLAFEDLAEELRLHGAPSALVRWATRSAREERSHARVVTGLAARWGVLPIEPKRAGREPRALASIATDNATEGLVRETYGAFLAVHQAANASDPEVARTMRGIAADEARHALLSTAIDGWARTKLSTGQRRVLDERRLEAHAALLASLDVPSESFAATLGLPDAERARELAVLVG